MKSNIQLSIVLVLIVGLLASVPNVNATGYMDGANWTGIDQIHDSPGMSYLKNSTIYAGSNITLTKNANGSVTIASIAGDISGMSNPATADLNMGNYNITGLGQNESHSYLIWTDGTNYYAKNGSTGIVNAGTNTAFVQSVFNNGGDIYLVPGTYILDELQVKSNTILHGGGNNTYLKFNNNITSIYLQNVENVEIYNLKINGSINLINTQNIKIHNNELVGGLVGVRIQLDTANQYAKDTWVYDNYIHNNGWVGVYAYAGSTGNIVQNLNVYGNVINASGWTWNPWGGGIVLEYMDTLQASIHHNTISYSWESGIHIETSGSNTSVNINNNIIHSNGVKPGVAWGAGIYVSSTAKTNIFENIIYDNFNGIFTTTDGQPPKVGSNQVFNNTVYNYFGQMETVDYDVSAINNNNLSFSIIPEMGITSTNNIIYDSSGYGRDCTWLGLTDSPSWNKSTGGLIFDGTNNNLTCGDGYNVGIVNELSIEVEISTTTDKLQRIVNTQSYAFRLNGDVITGWVFNGTSDDTVMIDTIGKIYDGKKHQIIFSWKAGGYKKIYYDGSLIQSSLAGTTNMTSIGQTLKVGERAEAHDEVLSAELFLVKIYNKETTNNEAKLKYINGIQKENNVIQADNFRVINSTGHITFGINSTGRLWNGTAWDWFLMPSKVFAGANTTVTNNNNGTVTIASTGASGCTDCPNATVAANAANWNNTYNTSYEYGGFDVPFSNGSSNLTVGTSIQGKAKYNGRIIEMSAHSQQTGSINITLYNQTLGTYICSVVISSGTDATNSCTSYSFVRGAWINATIISVDNIKQVTAAVQTIRS